MKRSLIRWGTFAALLLLIGFGSKPCHAATDLRDVIGIAVGANGIWADGVTAAPADIEAASNAVVSLSPHLSVVGSLNYGFDNSYFRWAVGPRVTVSDVDNPNFSIGIGTQFHGGSQTSVNPREWAIDATVGYVPWPRTSSVVAKKPINRVIVGIWGWRGLESRDASVAAGVRYDLPY